MIMGSIIYLSYAWQISLKTLKGVFSFSRCHFCKGNALLRDTDIHSRAPIGTKINQCHFGDLRPFSYKAPKICPDIRGRAKKQPVPWHGGTG